MLVSCKIAALPVAQCLTVGGAKAPGSRDDGERGAAVDRAEVVLHVGCHVGVRRAEGRLAGPGGVRRQADEGDIRDDRAAAQGRRPGKETETWRYSQPSWSGHGRLLSFSFPPHHLCPRGRRLRTWWEKTSLLAHAGPEASRGFTQTHTYIALNTYLCSVAASKRAMSCFGLRTCRLHGAHPMLEISPRLLARGSWLH